MLCNFKHLLSSTFLKSFLVLSDIEFKVAVNFSFQLHNKILAQCCPYIIHWAIA